MAEHNFDINQFVKGEIEPQSKEVLRYIEQLTALFEQSPEAQAVLQEDREADLWWAEAMLDYAMNYLGVSPPKMKADDLQEVLYGLFPAKVATPDGFDGKMVVRVLRAFWSFIKREFGLPSAGVCLKVLDERAAGRLNRAMSDPSLFGMAKSFVMRGKALGYDTSTEEGFDEWVQAYNTEMMLSSGFGQSTPQKRHTHREGEKERRKRKLAKLSRKKNRRK